MTTEMTNFDNGSDGWSDAASDYNDNIIRGEMLKCSSGHWLLGQENKAVPAGARFVAVGTATQWVKWGFGDDGRPRPVDHHTRKPGEPIPELEDLPDHTAMVPGPDAKDRPAWQLTRYLYLTNPEDASVCTFVTSTWKGREAIIALGNQIVTMRTARPGVSPVIELHSAPYKARYGTQQKPVLKVVGWVGGSQAAEPPRPQAPPTPKLKSIPTSDKPSTSPVFGHVANDMMDDEIPW
jgi:hypothetical protein